ncbi:MAG: RDD family protein [Actinomycetia bacterium]|nr:RDD family protein [Actinomycetes bacterium]
MPQRPDAAPEDYTGAELGLPRDGVGSLASLLRRALAAVIDWGIAQLIVTVVFDVRPQEGGTAAFAPLGVFLLMHLLLVGTIGTTIGHRIIGIGVRAFDGAIPRPVQTGIRTLMVALFFPAIFTASDGRGFHDKAAGTVTVRIR